MPLRNKMWFCTWVNLSFFFSYTKRTWSMTQGVRQVAQNLESVFFFNNHNKVHWDACWLFSAHYLTTGMPAASNVLLWQKTPPMIVNISASTSLLFPVCPSVWVSCVLSALSVFIAHFRKTDLFGFSSNTARRKHYYYYYFLQCIAGLTRLVVVYIQHLSCGDPNWHLKRGI